MMKVRYLHKQKWLKHEPDEARDIQRLDDSCMSVDSACHERDTRIKIMSASSRETDRDLAAVLSSARGGEPAAVGCCPVTACRFQSFYVDRALQVHDDQQKKGKRYTFFDPKDAVPFGKLHTVNWRKLHQKFRRRLQRTLGKHVVVIGFGEVEADEERGVWQPHYHVTIYGAKNRKLKELRRKHYGAKRTGVRPMRKSKAEPIAKWFAYQSKLNAFGKLVDSNGGPPKRTRLPDDLSRQFFRYVSRHLPTAFVFSMNCRIVKARK